MLKYVPLSAIISIFFRVPLNVLVRIPGVPVPTLGITDVDEDFKIVTALAENTGRKIFIPRYG
jgi:hypothetical protein